MRLIWLIACSATLLASCALLGMKSKGSGGECGDLEVPKDPPLAGVSESLRKAIIDSSDRGLVVVDYIADGCKIQFDVLPNCRAKGSYRYTAKSRSSHTVVSDANKLFSLAPFAGRWQKLLQKHGSLRFDEVVVGRLRTKNAPKDKERLKGDCDLATHVVSAIELGGYSLLGGKSKTLKKSKDPFFKRDLSKWIKEIEYVGDGRGCKKAKRRGRRTGGCDHPLRVSLVALKRKEEPKEETVVVKTTKRKSIAIPAGEFWMGSNRGHKDQRPQHKVKLDAYEIDTTEVTAGDYARCVTEGACDPPGKGRHCTGGEMGKERHPINCVTWKQAKQYCAFVDKRLPTEAEWERAARGKNRLEFVWGSAWPPPNRTANLCDRTILTINPHWAVIEGYKDGHPLTAPVGSFDRKQSPSGAQDLAGNVLEWTADYYGPHYYSRQKMVNPKGPKRGDARVVRGSSFGQSRRDQLKVTKRSFYVESTKSMHLGFRCVK